MTIETLRDNLSVEISRLTVAHEALSGMKQRGIKALRAELATEIKRLTAAYNALGTPVAVSYKTARKSVAA